MVTITSTVILTLISALDLKTTVSCDIALPTNIHQNLCLKQTLRKIVKDEESLTISWSDRNDGSVKDEVLNFFQDKSKLLITNRQSQTANSGFVNQNPSTVLMLASTMTDITDGLLSLHNKNVWSINAKFIVLYSDKSAIGSKLSEPFLKDVFQTFANLKALNVHLVYNFAEGINEFTWFPYEDSNCGSVHRVRLISDCEFGSFRNHLQVLNTNKLEGRCTITAAVQSSEPYSFYAKDAEFSTGVYINLLDEFKHWWPVNIELKPIDNRTEEAERKEKYFPFRNLHLRKETNFSIYFQ